MTRRVTNLGILLAMALAFAFGLDALRDRDRMRGAEAAPPEWRIAVVDLVAVMNGYVRKDDLERRINQERERLKRELEDRRKALNNLNKELDILDPESETWKLKEEEKEQAFALMNLTKRRIEEELKRRFEEYNVQLLEDVEKVVKAYGEENRYSFILKADEAANSDNKLLVGLKGVLYHTPEIDITRTIIEILNRQYELARPAGGIDGAGPEAGAPARRPATEGAPTAAPPPTAGGAVKPGDGGK